MADLPPRGRRVAVIGAGALGLMSLKELVEGGFAPTGFEARPYVGGLWKDADDSTISVHATTVFNSSKFRAAISDFPFPDTADVYPTAAQLHEYLLRYAERFDLARLVRLRHRVQSIEFDGARNGGTGEWAVRYEDLEKGQEGVEWFDRVCVATGSLYTPKRPKVQGIEKFQGKVLHSIDFHKPEPFRDQNVLIFGIAATAQDVTNALTETAKHVYLAHRHGMSLLPRYTDKGAPFDTEIKLPLLMLQSWLEKYFPSVWTYLIDRALAQFSQKAFPDIPEAWGAHPFPSMAVANPLMADTLVSMMKSGFAEPVPGVEEVTGPRSVRLTNGRVLEDLDAIIYCTGYFFDLPPNLIPKSKDGETYHPYPNGPGREPRLYKNMFPMASDSRIRESLVFIGQSVTIYPGLVQFELQAMAAVQIWRAGHEKLPPLEEMVRWYNTSIQKRREVGRKYKAPEDTIYHPQRLPLPDVFPWMNEMAGTGIYATFGGKLSGLFNANAWRLWWQDRELWDLCSKGVLSPAVFRVIETGGRKALSRTEAKAMLRSQNEALERFIASNKKDAAAEGKTKKRTI